MSARMPGLYCALHVGGGRSNAGDCLLFSDGQPILTEAGADCAARNLPTLNGQPQLAAPDPACIADFEARSDREILSVDLTGAYPKACGLRVAGLSLVSNYAAGISSSPLAHAEVMEASEAAKPMMAALMDEFVKTA